MKKTTNLVFLLCLITSLIGQNKIDDFDMYSYPTEWEFGIYKEAWSLMWDAPPGKAYEIAIQKKMEKKHNTTYEHIGKILMKLEWYSLNQPYSSGQSIEAMSWIEFQRLCRRMGKPWPHDPKNK